jgi:molecular chaperone GrpE (heat shock protein)
MADDRKPGLHNDLAKALAKLSIKDAEPIIKEFDLLSIPDEADDLVRETAKKVRDRVESHAQLLEDLLQPDTSLAAMNECSYFSDDELEGIVKTYRKLMSILRNFTVSDVDGKEYGKFITQALSDWQKQKPALQKIAKKLQTGWEHDQPLQREKGYFG